MLGRKIKNLGNHHLSILSPTRPSLRSTSAERGFTDTGVVLKLLVFAVIVAIVTCCNRWVKNRVMTQNGYQLADPNAPKADREGSQRGVIIRDGRIR
jgi:hypothetical protein